MYGQGLGVPADRSKSVEPYKAAAQQGNAVANFNFGIIYLNGDGVTQEIDLGVVYMKQAAHLGMQDAKDAKDALERLENDYGVEIEEVH